ncbi:uncharacterized protein LOC129237374 [Anastrepha obliqua]|uniref:uncharacterized protein LOC129237374 n=1 Tax=Anastrepha obliqua TaxID=95512 RepID=UPI0024091B59|nr:uncharacterized protein LOC129237374 [Anastrepha obliqua]
MVLPTKAAAENSATTKPAFESPSKFVSSSSKNTQCPLTVHESEHILSGKRFSITTTTTTTIFPSAITGFVGNVELANKMEDASPPQKKSTTLSVDRAAFLLLRVKKAFKKKRQQRKEKQTQAANAALISQARSGRKVPPPLLRSRTLPAIIVPGIPVVSLNTDRQFDERSSGLLDTKSGSGTSTGGGGTNRWSLLTRQAPTTLAYTTNNNNNMVNIKSLNLPKDDMGVYRRKSSGSTMSHTGTSASVSGTPIVGSQVADAALLMPTCEDFEYQAADGSLLLRIPAPHVVAARAYRLAAKKRSTGSAIHESQHKQHQQQVSSNTVSGEATGSGTTNTALTRRLAKLLHQPSMSASRLTTAASPHGDNGVGSDGRGSCMDEAPRRLSWERRKDSSALQRSASIDSFAEIVWSDTPRPSLDIPRSSVVPFSKRPSASSLFSNCSATSQTTQLNINYGAGGDLCSSGSSAGNSRRESLLSPSSTRRNKLTRIINASARIASVVALGEHMWYEAIRIRLNFAVKCKTRKQPQERSFSAAVGTHQVSNSRRWIDSGATSHMCGDRNLFEAFEEQSERIALACDNYVNARQIGASAKKDVRAHTRSTTTHKTYPQQTHRFNIDAAGGVDVGVSVAATAGGNADKCAAAGDESVWLVETSSNYYKKTKS